MKKLLLTLAIAAAVNGAMAQAFLTDPVYGNSPEERTDNVKLLNAFTYSYNIKDYAMASKELKELLTKIPAASENLYIRGIDIYKNFMANAKTDIERKKCMDSIMIMFDLRAKNFADHPERGRAYVLGQKALTFNNFADESQREQALKLFLEAIDAGKMNIGENEVELIGTYFKNVTDNYKFDEITADDYIQRYENLAAILAEKNNEFSKKVAADIEAMFASSGAASCDNIERIFKPQYTADPNNADLIKKILGLFARAKCSSPFQMELLEKFYQTDPKPEIAIMLAGAYEEKKDFVKASEFLNIAINNEQDPALKTSYTVRAAAIALQGGNYREASAFARRAMELEPSNSAAAFMNASAMLSGVSNSCSGENRQYAYWLVVDAFSQALSKMSAEDPMRSEAQNAIGSLSANFPKKTDLFMLGLEEGQSYSVSCGWVSGVTRVRGR